MDELELKNLIAGNIALYRKRHNMTQLELAEKLNYTDKAVSKWERGEALPDIFVLKQIATLFKISLDDLTRQGSQVRIHIGISIEKRVIIPAMSVLLVLLIATVCHSLIVMLSLPVARPWLAFIIALPTAFTCLIVFSAIWGKTLFTTIFVSALIWTLALLLYLLFSLPDNFLFFIIAVPGQVITVLWYMLIGLSKRRKAAAKAAEDN